ncbi:thiamine-phosphate kinase [Fuchsiella alkaliacetigena]|uniref:thiamine-phosphate kinase n=1 Tax=Fuchsiella alkaliacetigena TaxID=957042 RepID=UPI00200AE814|nr:thiamine-phosphate kinase [Fuchsiella alkaliacetigena]MCK8825808.1 thiamine-phosphate kinase [Fuchsiella alkaliacetigena]
MKIADLGEFALIDKIKENSIYSPKRVVQGIGDDAAVEKLEGEKYLLSAVDTMVEGVHFLRRKITPWQLGYKAVAINFSDLAAMGGVPTGILVSLAVPGSTEVEYVEEIYRGIKFLCKEYQANLLGGDTVSVKEGLVISVTVLGQVAPAELTLRSGAEVGDLVLVTGSLGASKAGLELIKRGYSKNEKYSALLSQHLEPAPRLKEGRFLAKTGRITSMNDISDGLVSEVQEIAEASQVGVELWAEQIPVLDSVKSLAEQMEESFLDWALFGGEDFQLVFTCSKSAVKELKQAFKEKFQHPLYTIGRATSQSAGLVLQRGDTKEQLVAGGYDHFNSPADK